MSLVSPALAGRFFATETLGKSKEHLPDAKRCVKLWRGGKKIPLCPSWKSKLKALNIYVYATRGQERVAAL